MEDHAGLLGFGNLTAFEISDLFNEADTNDDGIMDFEEFVHIVETCRDSGSAWKNAGALEVAVKRYNNVLAASDSLFATVQEISAASCEQDEQGRRVAGCSRVLAQVCVMVLNMLLMGLLFAAVGWQYFSDIQGVFAKIDHENAMTAFMESGTVPDPGDVEGPISELMAIFVKIYIPFVVYIAFVAVLTIVGWTRSQAHLGHVVFGFHVIDMESGEAIGTFAMILRVYLPQMLLTGIMSLAPEYFLESVTVFYGIHFIINPIMLLMRSDSRHVWDLILGQQVVVR